MFNILISSAGRRVSLLRLFEKAQKEIGLDGDVFASDIHPYSAAFQIAKRSFLVPRCTSDNFVESLLKLCVENDIKLIVPTIDTELPILAASKSRFSEAGIHVAVSDKEIIEMCSNKLLTQRWLRQQGLADIQQAFPSEVFDQKDKWQFPLFIKPVIGSSSIGAKKINTLEELLPYRNDKEFVVEKYASGSEFTLDVLVSKEGKFLCAVPRLRIEIRGGEVSKSKVCRSPILENFARGIVSQLRGACGVINIQIFYDKQTKSIYPIEINARFGGGFPLTYEAGGNYPRWLLEDLLGSCSQIDMSKIVNDLVMLRYDEGIFVKDAQSYAF